VRRENGWPTNWTRAPLGELGRWYGGGTPNKGVDAFWKNGDVPWFSPKDMKSFRLHSSEDRITRAAVERGNVDLFEPGTVLMVVRSGILAHTFPVSIAAVQGTMNQDLKGLVPSDGLNYSYIAYALRKFGKDILHTCSKEGTTVHSIETAALHRFEIPIAPTKEQRRIVRKLDELLSDLDAGIAALERARVNLKRYRAAVLKAAVEGRLTEKWRAEHADVEPASKLLERILAERRKRWEAERLNKYPEKQQSIRATGRQRYSDPAAAATAKLGSLPNGWVWVRAEQVCEFITKGTTPSASHLLSSGDVPFIKVYNLTNRGTLDFSVKPTFVSKEIHEGFLARSRVFPDDVLMNIVGPPLGKVAIVPDRFPEWNINQAIAIFRPVAGMDRRFLTTCLLSKPVLDWALARGKATAGQTNLTLEICRDLPLPLPPYEEQVAIADEVSRLVSIAEANERQVADVLALAGTLRQAILKRAFEGKLVAQDADDESATELLARLRAARAAQGERPVRRARAKVAR